MKETVNITIMDNIEAPASFISLLEEKGFMVNISYNPTKSSDRYTRSQYTTDYKGIKVLIKLGKRKADYGVISILHIYGNKLYLCGTEDLVNYVDKITRETRTRD